jgi:hypothetical protein
MFLTELAGWRVQVSRFADWLLFTWRASVKFSVGKMINRDYRGHSYSVGRGEILRSTEDAQMRKRLTRVLPLIKNES